MSVYVILIVSASSDRKEVKTVNYIFSFIVAVTARLVGDFVSKWLNSHNADK